VIAVETHQGYETRVYTPDHAPSALVMVLHGCTQHAEDIEDGSQFDAAAEENGFVVVYPNQKDTAFQRCWQWWDPANQKRDAGEAKALADIASEVATAHGLPTDEMYVAGISAGGAMTVILGATYPDRFAAIGVVAGLEYAAASSLAAVPNASANGGPDPAKQGELAKTAMGAAARALRVKVIQGDADGIVAPVNGEQVRAQWVKTNTLVLGDEGAATAMVDLVVAPGVGHAWPGGKAGASFSDPSGPNATKLFAAMFAGASPAPAADPPSTEDTTKPASTTNDSGGCTMIRHDDGPTWIVALVAGAVAIRRRRSTSGDTRSSR